MAQCGGLGNIDVFRKVADSVAAQEPFAPYFEGWRRPWNYASAEETAARLGEAGFVEVNTWLQPKRVVPEPGFVQTVCLVRHLDPLPDDVRPAFVDRVLEAYGEPPVLDYVRLNISARRG
jgi:trans-aconitate 2-methyltransferase